MVDHQVIWILDIISVDPHHPDSGGCIGCWFACVIANRNIGDSPDRPNVLIKLC